MRRSLRLALMVVATSCISAQIGAQTNPLWSEQKVKNFLPHMTWPEVRDLLTRSDMVLIPIPALEQHGFHGPIGTDYYSGVEQSKLIAQRNVADRLNQETPAVAVNLSDGVAAIRDPVGRPFTSSQPVPFDRHGGVGETSGALYLFPTLVQMDKAERATLSVPPALSSLPPLVATGDRAATLVFLAEALKPKVTGKGTSTAEMSTTGVWSERDPREATAEQGKRASDAFVDAAVRFIERWKQLRPLHKP